MPKNHLSHFLITLHCLLLLSSFVQAAPPTFSVKQQKGHLQIQSGENVIGDYVYQDPKILRPHFRNVFAPGNLQVTRHQPPREGQDATDHADMHPGIWLAFGDISGHDFWRNQGKIQHEKFTKEPTAKNGALHFATESTFLTKDAQTLAKQKSQFQLQHAPNGYLLVWDAEITPTADGFYFGDQEEMGLGVRVATPITEKNGGQILSSSGENSAKSTWGKPYEWCDYSGPFQNQHVGITIFSHPKNFRPSWWHNRDYGVFVANPFGRKALTQGEPSRIEVKMGESLRLTFGVLIHSSAKPADVNIPAAYHAFQAVTPR
ncbi:MAG: DUF6807 family protein [Pirellulales bacterium]